MPDNTTGLNILSWAEEDRPREKLIHKGRSVLSDAELIGILIGSGTRSLSAVDLAKIILNKAGNDLNELARLSIQDLMQFKGIGEAKAINIISALELGRRRKSSEIQKKPQIKSSLDSYEYIRADLLDLPHEAFWMILLNRANFVIKKCQISSGGISGTVVDPKIIYKTAIENLASSIILIHNHPSGNLKASDADIRLTKKLREAGNMLDIPILDHLIFSNSGYYSFADEGML